MAMQTSPIFGIGLNELGTWVGKVAHNSFLGAYAELGFFGGTLFFAFPSLYASAFSGFYLPLMIVLWLLILRGISIEFRSHLADPAWTLHEAAKSGFNDMKWPVQYQAGKLQLERNLAREKSLGQK